MLWREVGCSLEFSRIYEHRDTLTAEVSVVTTVGGALHLARLNLLSTQSRNGLTKGLDAAQPDAAWSRVVELSCRLVIQHLRQGEPVEPLVATKPGTHRWLVEQWIPLNEITVLFGDGGAGKSLFALGLACSGLLGLPLGGPWRVGPLRRVLYLDWESDKATHEERLWGLTRVWGEPPADTILYRRLWRPLTDDMATVRADCDRHHVDGVVVDSLGAAGGPEPESADAAIRTLMALRGLPGTKLVIAHVSKASAEQTHSRPFGSVYVSNLARSTIEARRQDTEDSDDLSLSLYHRKTNHGRQAKPSALVFNFDHSGAITIRKGEPDMKSASLPAQILDALRSGAKTVPEIAEEVAKTEAHVRKELNALEKRTNVVRISTVSGGRGNKTQWGLADRNRTEDA